MSRKTVGCCSRRERLEVMAAALTPAALVALTPAVRAAGRLGWLCPILALPVGLWLCFVWRRLGEKGLCRGLEEAFGSFGGKAVQIFYLLWGLLLLCHSGERYAGRLLIVFEGEGARWFFLTAALALSLWLGREPGAAFARAGRIFFLAALVMVGAALLLALPGVDWRNLWPPERTDWQGLALGGGWMLSLSGYGVYALSLSRRREEEVRSWPWTVWGCGLLAALTLVVTGAFGPTLAGRMKEPFLYLLEGVQVPGVFRRGEAALAAVLTLGDLVLLTLLVRGCVSLWRRVVPVWPWGGGVLAAGSLLVAGLLPGWGNAEAWLTRWLPAGNLMAGVVIPTLGIFLKKGKKKESERPIFSVEKELDKADVAEKEEGKKSCIKNEKKC